MERPSIGYALFIHGCMFWAFEVMAQAQALGSSPVFGLMNFMKIFFASFLFCGMFVAPTDVMWSIQAPI